MTDKQETVMDALQRLPENASLDELADELRIMARVRRGRADVAAGRAKTQKEVEQSFESWAIAWNFDLNGRIRLAGLIFMGKKPRRVSSMAWL